MSDLEASSSDCPSSNQDWGRGSSQEFQQNSSQSLQCSSNQEFQQNSHQNFQRSTNHTFPGKMQSKRKCSSSRSPEKRARFDRTHQILAKSGLLDITEKTALLLKSNQQANLELQQLKVEIKEFTKSVLSNPENRGKSLQSTDIFLSNPLSKSDSNTERSSISRQVSVIKQHSSN